MNLVFRKNEDLEISVARSVGDDEYEFSYVDMIKDLMQMKEMDDPVVEGDFTEAERVSIQSMVANINADVAQFYKESES